MKFGDTSEMTFIEIGSPYPFPSSASPRKGGRLVGENPLAMGYAECERCGKDFHCDVWIEDDRLSAVRPSGDEPPLCFDEEIEDVVECPNCGSSNTRLQKFEGYSIGRFLCDERSCYLHKIVFLNESGLPDMASLRDSTFPFKNGGEQAGGDQPATRGGVDE